MKLQNAIIAPVIFILALQSTSLQARDVASDADKAFVSKVSQGGMYEVEAGKLAEQKSAAQDVKDLAFADVHDHDLVNQELRRVAAANSVHVATILNPTFQQRLEKLSALSGAAFETAYIKDMSQIHDMDEKLFAQEAIEGTDDFKAFAAKTDLIVKRHIGALHGTDSK
jgi:putative membrane protein